MSSQNNNLHYLYVIVVGVLAFFAMVIFAMYQQNQAKTAALSEAVKFALQKGIEPLAVTCAYEMDNTPSPLCVMYVNRVQSTNDISVQVTKK